jgi:CRISPR-associated protein (TIGR03984 family)
MSKHKIKEITYNIGETKDIVDPLAELKTQVATGKYGYLLAHADDGVIWGYVDNKDLKLSSKEFPDISPKLRPETLWELRLFGEAAEWHLWRTEKGWLACTVVDGEGGKENSFDEQYILWGTDPEGTSQNGFHPVREADLGIVHTPPIKMNERHTLTLSVRHYIDHDDAGAAYIKISRLMNLGNGGVK